MSQTKTQKQAFRNPYVKPAITTLRVNLSFAAPSSDLPPRTDLWFDTFADSFLKRKKEARGKGA